MLDPLSIATSFSTIVGLLSNFKSERSGGQLPEFITWLQEKHHEVVVSGIEQNQRLSQQLESLLVLNHEDLVKRLDSLDMILASIAMNIDTFSSLATTIRPDCIFSEQAISIVKQFVASGASECWEQKYLEDRSSNFSLIGAGQLKIEEPRFVEDDFRTLVEFGILRLDFGSKGTRKFIITRKAVLLVS